MKNYKIFIGILALLIVIVLWFTSKEKDHTIIFGFVSALIGAIVGGYFTLEGSREAHRLEQERRLSEEREILRRFLQMIQTEVEVLWQRY